MNEVEAAVAAARDLGLRVGEPRVLAKGFNVVIHLAPSPVVARVPTLVEPAEKRRTLERNLVLSSHAVERGAAVVPPTSLVDPGPHRRGGHWVGLFEYVEHDPGAVADPGAIGASLRTLHDALASFTRPLPPFDPIPQAAQQLTMAGDSPQSRFLRELLPSLEVPDAPAQALHGDASYRNALVTPVGVRWTDLETGTRGPVEWDLAEVVTAVRAFGRPVEEAERALAAYGRYDPDLLDRLLDLRAFQHASFIVLYTHRRGISAPDAGGFIPWLRRRRGLE